MKKIVVTPYRLNDLHLLKQADAFLIGNENFAMRLTASFTTKEISFAKTFAFHNKKEVHILVNKIFHPHQLVELEEYLMFLKEIGVDKIYFGDLAVLQIAKKLKIENKLVYANETTLVNTFDCNFYLQEGINGVYLAKELSMLDIEEMSNEIKGSVYMLGCGYYHMYYSHRSIITNYTNKHHLELKDPHSKQLKMSERTRQDLFPIVEEKDGSTIFSPQILNCLPFVEPINRSQVEWIILDGIFHDINYLVKVLSIYCNSLENNIDESEQLKNEFPDKKFFDGFLTKKMGII